MALEPHWRRAAHAWTEHLFPQWRRARKPERRALAWAATGLSLTGYLFAFVSLGPSAGPGLAALYALPCLVAGWAFGASGGLLLGLLGIPVHAWLFASGVPMPPVLSAMAVGLAAGAARDLRERLHERGAQLAESEDRYRQLVDNSPEGVLVHERGVVVFANPAMARLAGVDDARALVGRTLVTLAPFEDREALSLHFIFAAGMRAPRSIEARLAAPDGALTDVVMTTMPIRYRGAHANLVLVREASLVRVPAKLNVKGAATVAATR